MIIKPLTNLSPAVVAATFNKAFEDYFVPVKLTPYILNRKMQQENLSFEHSIGAFKNDKLVGFMLHGIKGGNGTEKEAYNGGTGVLPAYRNKGLVGLMYEAQIKLLHQENVKKLWLEVIVENEPAIRAYRRRGFNISREVICYKGHPNGEVDVLKETYRFEYPSTLPWDQLSEYWNYQPTWQHQLFAIQNIQSHTENICIYSDSELVAYASFMPDSGRIMQFAVHPKHRKQGLAKQLFTELGRKKNPYLSILNIESTDHATLNFLQSIGFKEYIRQYEMLYILPK